LNQTPIIQTPVPSTPLDKRVDFIVEECIKKLNKHKNDSSSTSKAAKIFSIRPEFSTHGVRLAKADSRSVMEAGVILNHFILKVDPQIEFLQYTVPSVIKSDKIGEDIGDEIKRSRSQKMELMTQAIAKCGTLENQQDEYATDQQDLVVSWKDVLLQETGTISSLHEALDTFDVITKEASVGGEEERLQLQLVYNGKIP
jgi:hypothetical protein